MDDRVTEFVRGLRAAGVRVSLAEAIDAFQAVELLGIQDRDLFRESLRTTLIKESNAFPIFDRLFPFYFSGGDVPMQDATTELTDEELGSLNEALDSFNDRNKQLLEWLTSGNPPSAEELEKLAEQMSQRWQNSPRKGQWVTNSMLRELGMSDLGENLQKLMQKLREMGVRPEAIDALLGITRENASSLRERVAEMVGLEVSREQAERTGNGTGEGADLRGENNEIMNRPFEFLSETDTEQLRVEVRRMVQQLRSRAALRRKKDRVGKFDPKSTIRANQRYGGIPLELKFKKRKLKPNLVFFVDVSGSMERIVEFLLRFMHQLADQVSKVRIFLYYADLSELNPQVLDLVGNNMVDDAFYVIRYAHPYRPYATNLGYGLETFFARYLGAVDNRSTVVFLGDGRNNHNAPRGDLVKALQHRAKRLVWLNPEERMQWGQGDSDMAYYVPYCDAVHVVRSLGQLSRAIDSLLV